MLTPNLKVNGKREHQAQVDRWAQLIESSGLSVLALSVIEMVDTFGVLLDQAILAVEPLMRGVSTQGIEQTAHLLRDSEMRSQLRNRLTRGHSSDE
jgi:hypothetical protein